MTVSKLFNENMHSQSHHPIETWLRAGAFTSADVSTESLRDELATTSHETKGEIVVTCETLLENREFGMVDDNRVSVVKLLVALLPESYGLIRRWMFLSGDIYYHEVQFTLCCFLCDVLSFMPHNEEITTTVLSLVKEYLYAVTSDEAHNAMMAADMLGEHWRGDEGMKVLSEIARQPTDSVGRKAAKGALEYAARRGKKKSNAVRNLGIAVWM